MTIESTTSRASPPHRRRSWRWQWTAMTTLLVLALMGVSVGEIVALEHRAAASRRAQVELAKLVADVGGYRYIPQGIAQGALFSPASALIRALGPVAGPWDIVVAVSGGRLLGPVPPG